MLPARNKSYLKTSGLNKTDAFHKKLPYNENMYFISLSGAVV